MSFPEVYAIKKIIPEIIAHFRSFRPLKTQNDLPRELVNAKDVNSLKK